MMSDCGAPARSRAGAALLHDRRLRQQLGGDDPVHAVDVVPSAAAIQKGDIVLMTAAGAGLTGGAVVFRW